MTRSISLLFVLFCSACIQLGSEPQPTRYYLLEPLSEIRAAANSQRLHLELVPIEFPSYLDRPQIVSRTATNGIHIAEHDRWAEPLADSLARTIQENLRNRLPNIRISSAPWNHQSDTSYLLRLTVNRFDGILGEQADVDIRWTLIAQKNNQELSRMHFNTQLAIDENYQGLVQGLNSALAQLSDQLADALASLP